MKLFTPRDAGERVRGLGRSIVTAAKKPLSKSTVECSVSYVAPLPPSTARSKDLAPHKETVASTFQWSPVQVRQHEIGSEAYCVGTYVNTMSMDIQNWTFEDSVSHMIKLEPNNFRSQGTVWVYIVGGALVMLKGLVHGFCPREHDPRNGRNMRVARLPVGLRPRDALQFAASAREAYEVGGRVAYRSQLVSLVVTPDGWIMTHSSREVEGVVDLSAVRFFVGGGISLIDDVSLHTLDTGGTRLVCLQGCLDDRFYSVHSKKPLALLPESCRPPKEMHFVCAGMSSGGFHLVSSRPAFGNGCGGDIVWRDSIWNHDKIHLTGMLYEVSAEAVPLSTLNQKWSAESSKIFVNEFQRFLVRRFGTIETAWSEAFDTDGSGAINFTEFGLGCKAVGYVGNTTRLWVALDDDLSGEISMDELAVDSGDTTVVKRQNSDYQSGGRNSPEVDDISPASPARLSRRKQRNFTDGEPLDGKEPNRLSFQKFSSVEGRPVIADAEPESCPGLPGQVDDSIFMTH